MGKRIRILTGSVRASAELNDSTTARAIFSALPLKASANMWGDEVYFAIPVTENLDETAKETVELGELGYWPTGRAFCIFFGPTPISRGNEIRPAGKVNAVGRIIGDPSAFKSVRDGDRIALEIEE